MSARGMHGSGISGKKIKIYFFLEENRRSPRVALIVPLIIVLAACAGPSVKTADVALEFWWGLFVPKGTPEPIKARLQKAAQDTMANPALRERLAKVDTDPSFAPGPALRVKLENEIKNWSKFIDAKGIKVEQ